MSAVLEFGFNAAPVFTGVDAMERRVKSADAAIIASQQKLEAAMKNPWVSAGIQQKKYFDQLVTTERQTRQIAAAHAKLATYTGPKAAPGMSPWASAGAGQWAEAKRMEESIRAQNAAITAQEERIRARNAALDAWKPSQAESLNTNRILYMQAMADRAARGSKTARGGGGGMQIGGAAMQVQDIAVQLQMGTRLSTVIAQQGSQMLSMFGAGGAVFGGLVAVGGAFLSMGANARKSLDETISGARDLRSEIDLLAQGGSMEEVSLKLAQIGTSGAAAFQELNSFNSLKGGFWTEILALFGGPTGNDKFAGLQSGIMAGAAGRQELQQRLLDLSAQELQLAELKAAGDEENLARMQREIALAQELARIQRLNISDPAKAQLAADAQARSDLGAQTAKDPKRTAQDIRDIQKRMNDERLAALPAHERYFELSDMQRKVFERMDQEGGVFFEKSHQGLKDWAASLEQAGKSEALLNVLKLMEEINAIQKEMDAALKDSNDERDRQQDLIDRQLKEAQTKRADEFMRTLAPAQRGPMQAIAAAQASASFPISTRARMFTEADRQAGWSHPSLRAGQATLMGSAGGGGLDAHYRNQRIASPFEMLQRTPSQWQQLQQQHQNNAAAQGGSVTPTTVESAVQKILEALPPRLATALLGGS